MEGEAGDAFRWGKVEVPLGYGKVVQVSAGLSLLCCSKLSQFRSIGKIPLFNAVSELHQVVAKAERHFDFAQTGFFIYKTTIKRLGRTAEGESLSYLFALSSPKNTCDAFHGS